MVCGVPALLVGFDLLRGDRRAAADRIIRRRSI
jgi:hypothetical protein